MNRTIHQTALSSLAVVLCGLTGNGIAQEPGATISIPAPGCPQDFSCLGPSISMTAKGTLPGLQAQIGVITTGGMAVPFPESAEVVKNQPYQAQAVTEMKQTLADGSHITQTTTATVARDSDGRTVRIQRLSTIGPWKSASDSSQTNPTLTTIFDPVANTHIDYTSDSKIAHVLAMPGPPPPGAQAVGAAGFAVFAGGPGTGGGGPVTFSVQGHGELPGSAENNGAKPESLGTKTIEGISVTGTKDTETIPAGTIGNDKALVITRETWYSPDLKLVIKSAQKDPRFGETSYSLTNIQRNEPDSTLFQVPAGYKVEKVPVMVRSQSYRPG